MIRKWLSGIAVIATLVAGCTLGASNAYADTGYETMETARGIGVNTTYTATTIDSSDKDWYRFELSQDGPIRIIFDNEQHSSGKWYIYLVDANGESMTSFEFPAKQAHHESTVIGLPAGETFYIRVLPAATWGTYDNYRYSLRVEHTSDSTWETEPNDDIFESADLIEVNKPVKGSTYESGEKDWYRFTLSEASPVQIAFENEQKSNGSWLVYLKDSDGETIVDDRFYANEASHVMSEVTLSPGTYYAHVLPVTGWGSVTGLTYSLTVRASSLADELAMYRLYNPNTGEHFYTSSVSERDSLSNVGWKYEGVGWIAPTAGDPVYRLYNSNAPGGDHHYTMDAAERDQLVRYGWKYEGIGWYSGGSVPLYRQYNPNALSGTHNYTVDKVENDNLVAVGWKAEGIAWYALRKQ